MTPVLFAYDLPTWLPPVLNVALLLVSVLLIGLILIQRGKGGGLAGALGGPGGSSAFGSRAGDAYTRFTINFAAVWLILIIVIIKVTQTEQYVPEMGKTNVPAASRTGGGDE